MPSSFPPGDSIEAVAYALFLDCKPMLDRSTEIDLLKLYARCLATVRGKLHLPAP